MQSSQQTMVRPSSHQRSDLTEGAGFPNASREIARIPPNHNDPNGYYDLLNLKPWASAQEVKEAFRREAKIYHPDGSEPDEAVFRHLQQMYEVLSDPVKRQEYNSTPKGCIYLGDIERKSILDAHSLEELEAILEENVDIQPFFSYYGLVTENAFAQQWYEVILAAMHALQIKGTVQVSITNQSSTHVESGIIYVPTHIDPNYFIALRLVNRLKGNH